MGVFKRQRKTLLTSKKHFKSRARENIGRLTLTSTPIPNRKRTIHCRKLTPFRSPITKRTKLSPVNRSYSISSPSKRPAKIHLDFSTTHKDESTILYSDMATTSPSSSEIDFNFDELCPSYEKPRDEAYDTFLDALKVFKEHNVETDITTFLKLVSERKFPLDNVAFQLFLDVVNWFSCSDTRLVRYNETSMKFFWVGKRLFGGRFLRFMGGPKNESHLLLGSTSLPPSESKINFACPSNSLLTQFNPLGYEMSFDDGPGIITQMIDLIVENKKDHESFVIMFDGKKIKRGADMDLLGFENDPVSEKKRRFDEDMELVSETLQKTRDMNIRVEDDSEIDSDNEKDLLKNILKCFKMGSKYLMEIRQLRKSKEMALNRYKERILKDASLAKTLEYAIDSCRTSLFLIDNIIESLLDIQFMLCKSGAYINGLLGLFPMRKGEMVNVCKQGNVHLLRDDVSDDLPTERVRQRTDRWYKDRQEMLITGSTIYSAVGCDSLKRLHTHFDNVVSGIQKECFTDTQREAMKHGTESEVHQIATLSSVVLPFLFPDMEYFEEGYYIQDKMLVSPDGSLRNKTGSEIHFAFEGKAPSFENLFVCLQHYSVPLRYITQTVFESKFMQSKEGTIYMCWTPDSSTLFRVPKSDQICESVESIAKEIYTGDVPKRPSRIPAETKELKEKLKTHVTDCEFLGEFPSVYGTNAESGETVQGRAENPSGFSYQELSRSLLRLKQTLKDIYNIRRTYASQVLVYLLADLDRLWKPELPHAVPVMFCYRGYSLPMDVAKKLLGHCIKACVQKGLHVPVVSSDGEFIPIMVQGTTGQPLTRHQLNKQVWEKVNKLKKNEVIKLIKNVNKGYLVITNESGKRTVESTDGGFRIKTPLKGWKATESQKGKARKVDIQEYERTEEVGAETVRDGDPGSVEQDAMVQDVADEDPDQTLAYDFEQLLLEAEQPNLPNIISTSEANDICTLLKDRNPVKWKYTDPDQITDILLKYPKSLLKDELLDVSKYLNLKLIGTEKELKVRNVTKQVLLEQLGRLLGSKVEMKQRQRKKRVSKQNHPKTLQDLATSIITKQSYPKRVLSIAYASYIWPGKVKEWLANGKCAEQIIVYGHLEEDNMFFEPYYIPDFDHDQNDFRIFAYDKTHLGTNLRKVVCLDKVKGISIKAWKLVALHKPEMLHPSIIEVTDGKILDQMKETLARTMLTKDVEDEMTANGFTKEAEFCKVVREGLYEADDMPGISAYERCKRRLSLIEWLDRDVDFGDFPPFGNTILGMSHILYEGLRTSQEGKIYLYALANAGTYCVRAPNTLCSESFFGSMQETDPWGQGILSASGVQKHLADFTTITAMKMDETRNVYIKTKSDTAYPSPTLDKPNDMETEVSAAQSCECRKNKYIQCIVPKNHFFDTADRARLQKKEKIYKPGAESSLRGERPIRQQYGYTINEARMLPSKRLAIESKTTG